MSDVLPADAPGSESAASTDEVEAPVTGTAVDDGSAEKRFNGLMSRYQKDQDESKATIQALEAELAEARKTEEEQKVPETTGELDSLRGEVSELKDLLQGFVTKDGLDAARKAAVNEYPEVAPFADLLVADSPEGILDVARTFAERMTTSNGPAAEDETKDVSDESTANTDAESGDGNEPPPVVGGAVGTAGDNVLQEKKQKALADNDFFAYVNAAKEQQLDGLEAEVS